MRLLKRGDLCLGIYLILHIITGKTRHPVNWLPFVKGLKAMQIGKKLPKPTKIKNCLNNNYIFFGCRRYWKFLQVSYKYNIFLQEHGILNDCNTLKARYLFQEDKHYDVSYDTGDKVFKPNI